MIIKQIRPQRQCAHLKHARMMEAKEPINKAAKYFWPKCKIPVWQTNIGVKGLINEEEKLLPSRIYTH